ncbi:MAG: hypothetical protein V5A34_01705 [Halapricum sp.]
MLDRLREELHSDGYAPDAVERILEEAAVPFLYPRSRETTPLKKQADGERVINLAEWVGEVLADYLQVNRDDVTDDEGRQPLLPSQRDPGRLSKGAMRNWTYILTQACEFGGECPHDRNPETCEARELGHGSKCPSTMSPHRVRTGAITHHRDRSWPLQDLADRANTSEELIEATYDQPEEIIRGASRRDHLEKLE